MHALRKFSLYQGHQEPWWKEEYPLQKMPWDLQWLRWTRSRVQSVSFQSLTAPFSPPEPFSASHLHSHKTVITHVCLLPTTNSPPTAHQPQSTSVHPSTVSSGTCNSHTYHVIPQHIYLQNLQSSSPLHFIPAIKTYCCNISTIPLYLK